MKKGIEWFGLKIKEKSLFENQHSNLGETMNFTISKL